MPAGVAHGAAAAAHLSSGGRVGWSCGFLMGGPCCLVHAASRRSAATSSSVAKGDAAELKVVLSYQ